MAKSLRRLVWRVSGAEAKIKSLGSRLRRSQEYNAQLLPAAAWLPILKSLEPATIFKALQSIDSARSQIGQDLFALLANNFERDRWFLEVGATDGVEFSNTFLLEKAFGWSGVLVEPADCWHSALEKNRSSAVERRALWPETDKTLEFVEASVLSTIKGMGTEDGHHRSGKEYTVPTISPGDLLSKYKAPTTVDFLSIDTEGSELQILESFPFDDYLVRAICVEHNYTSAEEKIQNFLEEKGFRRVLRDISTIDGFFLNTRTSGTDSHSW